MGRTGHLTLSDLAGMDRDEFITAFGEVFEHSPDIAEAAWVKHPFNDVAALHAAMMAAVRSAPAAQMLAFLRRHPELVGKEAQAGTMTGHSTFEQHSAGLDALSSDEGTELRELNAAYARRHGFPFIIAVLNHSRMQIFDALRERIEHETAQEVIAACDQIELISRRRLDAMFEPQAHPERHQTKELKNG